MADYKRVIDLVCSQRSGYHLSSNRRALKCCTSFCLLPCFCFSILSRFLLCPFQCISNREVGCNPLYACLIDSDLSHKSDRIIIDSYEYIDKKHRVLFHANVSEYEPAILYAADKISSTDDIKLQYMICEVMNEIFYLYTHGTSSLSPSSIVSLAEKIRSDQKS